MFRHTALRAGLMFAAVAFSVTGAAGIAHAMPASSGAADVAAVSQSDRDARDRDRRDRFDDDEQAMLCEGQAIVDRPSCSSLPY
ncbi:hypothetical protein C8E05_5033 [Rhodococcus wratislaviensis]|uniref:Uncharacterized protein n=3 Tax=Rhodococcus TaxID=1827 RepID=A0AB38FCT2_RHOWR|nr:MULTISPECIES: hypothetical protein [Rhodococcus]AII07813.1 hypothetical protein EP51_25510 [Rhodococcus opacus]REE75567.1 hypothetical protein C8E05_5033 [Rhodococcus wratislaviensis]WAM11975.1 hypothetical protein OYT95_21200 [Rhodococcus sp. JS3073]SPZ39397.1 Uncharacterised protein [Rhodococcus wratislaviensis]GAF50154.1 hypothetical protein RW1_094_01940 [Rhodococcus wratislaviensis NBRC 100605]